MRASERVYRALREEIVLGHLPPGAELGEVEQAERWGVSRTPLREALGRLVGEGLAVTGRGRTLVVSGLSPDDVVDLFALREALETQAVRLASRRDDGAAFEDLAQRFASVDRAALDADPARTTYYDLVADMDAAIDAAAGNPHLRRSLVQLHAHVARVRHLAHDDPDRLLHSAQEHRLICRAVADRDPVLAVQATAVHLRASLDHVLGVLARDAAGRPHLRPVPTAGAAR